MATSITTALALLVALGLAAPAHSARPVLHHGPIKVSLRDGEGIPPPRSPPRKRPAPTVKADRTRFDLRAGNNYEAALQASGCREFLATYLPQEFTLGDARFYLKLVADADAELALEDGVELREYRRLVDIAYLIISVDRAAWDSTPARFRQALCTMFMPMLRCLYPGASLYVTVYDGQTAVASSSWKTGARSPRVGESGSP